MSGNGYIKLLAVGVGGVSMFFIGKSFAKENKPMWALGTLLGGTVGFILADTLLPRSD